MRIFLLDDEALTGGLDGRHAMKDVLKHHDLTIATSFYDAIRKFDGVYDLLLLDHDMEGRFDFRESYPNTGYNFCKSLVQTNMICRVIIHSHNPWGRDRMRKLLVEHGYPVQEMPYSEGYLNYLRTL